MEDLFKKTVLANNPVIFNSLAVKSVYNSSVLNFCHFKKVIQASATK